MLRDFAAFGCNEAWNHARLKRYVEAGYAPPGWEVHGCSCPELEELLSSDPDDESAGPYTTPAGDDAPWYDANVPESADFAGFLALEVEGLEDSPVYRTPRTTLNNGSVIGRERIRGREIRVRGVLLGRTCCSIDYGMRWLSQVLRGSGACSCDSCAGDQLEVLRCCPDTHLAGCGETPANDDQAVDYAAFLARQLRCFRGVGLIEGPRVVDRHGAGCGSCGAGCEVLEVEFVLLAGEPWAYTLSDDVITDEELTLGDGECVEFCDHSTDPNGCGGGCGCEAGDCPVGDPDCVSQVSPPSYLAPETECCCRPLDTAQTCYPIESEHLTEWFEAVPVITLFSGRLPLRNVTFRFHANPLGLPCGDVATGSDPCASCDELHVTYLAAGQTIVLDGRTRKATITCPGEIDANGSSVVFGQDCGPATYPVLTCSNANGYCLCVEVQDQIISDDAKFTVSLVGREF